MPLLSLRLSSTNSRRATIKRSSSAGSLNSISKSKTLFHSPPPATTFPESTPDGSTELGRIAIVGGGIAGLCSALSLIKTTKIAGEQITIYEPKLTLDAGEGSGLNLNSAAAILSNEYGINLSDDENIACNMNKAISIFYTQPNSPTLFNIDFKQSFKNTPYLYNKELDHVHITTILRESLQLVLYNQLVKYNVSFKRGHRFKIQGITNNKHLIFNDQTISPHSYDLIVGADGVKSNIRKYIINNCTMNKQHKERKDIKKPKYTGIRVAWILAKNSDITLSKLVPYGEMRQYVCDGGTVVSYSINKHHKMIAYLYRDKIPAKENVAFKQDETNRRKLVANRMKLSNCPEEFVKQFQFKGERFIESAVYEHMSLPTWSCNQVVLVGDAAHAMAPFLGQGANQTIQDAHVLGLVLKKLGNEYASIDQALNAYENVFKDKVKSIRKKSRMLGFLYTQQGMAGHMLRKGLLRFSRGTGFVEKDIISAFQPRFQ